MSMLGHKHTPEMRAKMSAARRGHRYTPETRARLSAALKGHVVSPETRAKMSAAKRRHVFSPETRAKISAANRGRVVSPETRAKISAALSGPNSPAWLGGNLRNLYAWAFNEELKEEVRRRDFYKCQLCGVPQAECKTALSVHHINYNKKDSDPLNLITLCVSCHSRTNMRRQYWKVRLEASAERENMSDTGIFYDVPFETYHAWEGLSRSRCWTLYGETPARFKWEQDHPDETTTKAMRDGAAIHMMLLEPERFKAEYIVGGPVNERTGKPFGEETKAYAEWSAAQAKPVLPQATYDTGLALSQAIHADPYLGKLLATMKTEVSLQWTQAESGLLLKGRLDAVNTHAGVIVDLKTCQSASAQRFGSDAYRNGYLFQAAMYAEGLKACGHEFKTYILAALEKEPPYQIQCFRIGEEQIELGRAQVADALRSLALCEKYQDWPAYPTGLQDLLLPGWAGQEWSAYSEGLEEELKRRAQLAGRALPLEEEKEDDDGYIT